ncbi:hypothetical protein C0Q70_09674 [Pomacea canaliculata]|uniref:Uncharacterized protein n=1 Tax=Pomacea canaliculata TaxID=400727 RepID=A0A2T7PAG8_POMCA|nr:hypothetical protein C0Q70_09674 [Pomacea canaliculata]
MLNLLVFSALVACALAGNLYGPYGAGYGVGYGAGYGPGYGAGYGAGYGPGYGVGYASGVADSISAVPSIGATRAAPGISGANLLRPGPIVAAAPVVGVASGYGGKGVVRLRQNLWLGSVQVSSLKDKSKVKHERNEEDINDADDHRYRLKIFQSPCLHRKVSIF